MNRYGRDVWSPPALLIVALSRHQLQSRHQFQGGSTFVKNSFKPFHWRVQSLVSKTLYFLYPKCRIGNGIQFDDLRICFKIRGVQRTVPTASASHEIGCPRMLGSKVRITQYIPLYKYKWNTPLIRSPFLRRYPRMRTTNVSSTCI